MINKEIVQSLNAGGWVEQNNAYVWWKKLLSDVFAIDFSFDHLRYLNGQGIHVALAWHETNGGWWEIRLCGMLPSKEWKMETWDCKPASFDDLNNTVGLLIEKWNNTHGSKQQTLQP